MASKQFSRCLFALLIPAILAAAGSRRAHAQSRSDVAVSNPRPSAGRIPLAPSKGYACPRHYPSLDVGLGLRTFAPDMSGLSGVYGGTPRFGFSTLLSGVVEIGVSDLFSFQADAGTTLTSENQGYQGLAGIAFSLRSFSNPNLRTRFGAGVAICSFKAEVFHIITEAGATGLYACGGLEYLPLPHTAFEIYGGYTLYPRVSTLTDLRIGPGPYDQVFHASVDFSRVIIGLRFKWLS